MAYVFSAPVGTLIATPRACSRSSSASRCRARWPASSPAFAQPQQGPTRSATGSCSGSGWKAGWSRPTGGRRHLLNASNDLVVLPNSGLAKATAHQPQFFFFFFFQSQSQPRREAADADHAHHGAVGSFGGVADGASQQQFHHGRAGAAVEIKSLDAQAIEFELSFRVKDFADRRQPARHEVYDLIYRHARAAGLQLAPACRKPPPSRWARWPRRQLWRHGPRNSGCWTPCPLFASLSEAEKEALARTMTRKAYRKGEVLVEQGANSMR